MEKSKLYPRTYFSAEHIKNMLTKLADAQHDQPTSFYYLIRDNESWTFDDEHEYFAAYRKDHDNSFLKKAYDQITFKIRYIKNNYTDITIEAPTIKEVESIFETFERLYSASKQKV
jgi:hypothetical protein